MNAISPSDRFPSRPGDDDVHRLNVALAKMLGAGRQDIADEVMALRRFAIGRDPLSFAFACLVIADLSLRRTPGIDPTDAVIQRLFALAVSVGERIVVGEGRAHAGP